MLFLLGAIVAAVLTTTFFLTISDKAGDVKENSGSSSNGGENEERKRSQARERERSRSNSPVSSMGGIPKITPVLTTVPSKEDKRVAESMRRNVSQNNSRGR